jgi:hypothetical protein
MVELYCELLLARANVLDQMAFSAPAVVDTVAPACSWVRFLSNSLARSLARVPWSLKATAGAKGAGGAGESTGSRFGFSWLGGGAQKKEAEPS